MPVLAVAVAAEAADIEIATNSAQIELFRLMMISRCSVDREAI
jgi:hypothetical protein